MTQILYNRPQFPGQLDMAHPLTKDLHGCWLLNENGGLRAMDLSPYGRHGLLTGFATPPLRPFNGLPFDGVDDYVVTAYSEAATTLFTAVVWLKPYSVTGDQYIFSHGGTVASDTGWSCGLSGALIRLTLHGVGNYDSAASLMQLNAWQMVAWTVNGTSLSIYHNGLLNNSQTTGTMTAGTHLFSFASDPDGGRYYAGQIACGMFYKRILIASEVKQLYQSPYDIFMN